MANPRLNKRKRNSSRCRLWTRAGASGNPGVLKLGGQIALLDFMATDEYLVSFQALGWRVIDRPGSSFQMFPPVRVVSGKKPV